MEKADAPPVMIPGGPVMDGVQKNLTMDQANRLTVPAGHLADLADHLMVPAGRPMDLADLPMAAADVLMTQVLFKSSDILLIHTTRSLLQSVS